MHENDDELSKIRQHLSQTPTEGVGALAGALADDGAMSAPSIHEDDDELSAIRQHLNETPSEGAGALAGALPGSGADEGAISATSIQEDDDEVFEKRQHISVGACADKRPYEVAHKGALLEPLTGAGAVEGALSATSVHEDDDELSLIRQHLSHAPTSSILPVLNKTAVS